MTKLEFNEIFNLLAKMEKWLSQLTSDVVGIKEEVATLSEKAYCIADLEGLLARLNELETKANNFIDEVEGV